MRLIPALLAVLLLVSPTIASGQSVMLHGSGGPTINDPGYSLSAGLGFTPTSRVTFMVDVERTHLSSRVSTDNRNTVSAFRGGTLTLAAAELRVSLLGRERAGPYALAGVAAGVSRPTVNDMFPNRVTNAVRAVFFGGGIHAPLRNRVSLFADARLLIGSEAGELLAVAPIRAGISWRSDPRPNNLPFSPPPVAFEDTRQAVWTIAP